MASWEVGITMPSTTRTHGQNTPPLDEIFIPCAVCGMQVDAERTAMPQQEHIVHTTTGTTYHSSDVASIDLDVNPTIGHFASCWFCGSPNYLDANDTTALKRFKRR